MPGAPFGVVADERGDRLFVETGLVTGPLSARARLLPTSFIPGF
jgi:hypothetical protein